MLYLSLTKFHRAREPEEFHRAREPEVAPVVGENDATAATVATASTTDPPTAPAPPPPPSADAAATPHPRPPPSHVERKAAATESSLLTAQEREDGYLDETVAQAIEREHEEHEEELARRRFQAAHMTDVVPGMYHSKAELHGGPGVQAGSSLLHLGFGSKQNMHRASSTVLVPRSDLPKQLQLKRAGTFSTHLQQQYATERGELERTIPTNSAVADLVSQENGTSSALQQELEGVVELLKNWLDELAEAEPKMAAASTAGWRELLGGRAAASTAATAEAAGEGRFLESGVEGGAGEDRFGQGFGTDVGRGKEDTAAVFSIEEARRRTEEAFPIFGTPVTRIEEVGRFLEAAPDPWLLGDDLTHWLLVLESLCEVNQDEKFYHR